jgi:hypothetical protein
VGMKNEKERNKAKLMKSQKVREKDSKDREKRKENRTYSFCTT